MVKNAQLMAQQLRQPGQDVMSGLEAQYFLALLRGKTKLLRRGWAKDAS